MIILSDDACERIDLKVDYIVADLIEEFSNYIINYNQ